MINSDSEELGFRVDFMTNSLGKTKKKENNNKKPRQFIWPLYFGAQIYKNT